MHTSCLRRIESELQGVRLGFENQTCTCAWYGAVGVQLAPATTRARKNSGKDCAGVLLGQENVILMDCLCKNHSM